MWLIDRKFVDLEMQLAKSPLAQQGMNADIKQTVTLTPNAVTVKDVPLTRMNVKLRLRVGDGGQSDPGGEQSGLRGGAEGVRSGGHDGAHGRRGPAGAADLRLEHQCDGHGGDGHGGAGRQRCDCGAAGDRGDQRSVGGQSGGGGDLPIARWVSRVPAMIGLGGDARLRREPARRRRR